MELSREEKENLLSIVKRQEEAAIAKAKADGVSNKLSDKDIQRSITTKIMPYYAQLRTDIEFGGVNPSTASLLAQSVSMQTSSIIDNTTKTISDIGSKAFEPVGKGIEKAVGTLPMMALIFGAFYFFPKIAQSWEKQISKKH